MSGRRNVQYPAGQIVMTVEARAEAARTLTKAKEELRVLLSTTESEIQSAAIIFESMAGHGDTILNLAAAVVRCVEDEKVSSILPQVQLMGAAVRRLIEDRLEATARIMEMVTAEVKLLRQLSRVTRGQEGIALVTKALSVLTNIEMARLGSVGAGFQYLARELADFARSVTEDTQELTSQTDLHRAAIEETRRVLGVELPRQQEELDHMEADLGNALASVESSLARLGQTPAQFRLCVEGVAQQIAGAVAAIQAHDITRQQIEHVQDALTIISTKILGGEGPENDVEIAQAYAGITIQVYQLRTIRETITRWASQIRGCTDRILRVSAAELVGIGPEVLYQESDLSSQVAHIERLERASQAQSDRIQRAIGGLSGLMQLVSVHLQRSKTVRDHLQLLTFNSIIEANDLGAQAAAILAIAESIKGISADWSEITDQSGQALQAVMDLVRQTNRVMEAFSKGRNAELQDAQIQTKTSLISLRAAAEFAAAQAQEMKVATDNMQAKTTLVGQSVDRLDVGLERIEVVLSDLEGVIRQMDVDFPGAKERYDPAEVEKLFAANYTTEMEREVLHAALRGTGLPSTPQTLVGNSAELF